MKDDVSGHPQRGHLLQATDSVLVLQQVGAVHGDFEHVLFHKNLQLKTAPLNKGEGPLSLLRTPVTSKAGVSDNDLLVKARVEVKDDIRTFKKVNLEPVPTRSGLSDYRDQKAWHNPCVKGKIVRHNPVDKV